MPMFNFIPYFQAKFVELDVRQENVEEICYFNGTYQNSTELERKIWSFIKIVNVKQMFYSRISDVQDTVSSNLLL